MRLGNGSHAVIRREGDEGVLQPDALVDLSQQTPDDAIGFDGDVPHLR